ncbi:MAG TPA: hypothetical protein VL172_13605 [Kofleriaceae bacterium]|nr:hypothetical protein [Kofleriaceae bacterium]
MRATLAIVLTTIAVAAGCSAELGEGPSADRVVVLDREPGVDVSVGPDRIELAVAGNEPLLGLEPGQLLVCGRGHGFLRSVVSVEQVGDRIVVHTGGATLADAIPTGHIHNQMVFGGHKEPTGGSLPFEFEGFAVGIGGTTLVGNEHVDAELTEGHFDFDPDLDLDIDLDGASLDYFNAVASGTIDASLVARVHIDGNAAGYFDKDLWKTERTFVQLIGYVPVVETVELALGVGLSIEGEGSATVEVGGSTTATVSAGARYQDGEWSAVGDHDASFAPQARVIEGDADLSVSAYLYAELTVKLYDAIGPSIDVWPYAALTHTLGEPGWVPSVGIGSHFEGHVDVPIVDEGWTGFSAELFDVSHEFPPIGAGDAGTPPAADACGDVTWEGECQDGAVTWCDGGALRSFDCAASGWGCGWVDDDTGNYCVSGCGDLDGYGACTGDGLRWCEGDTVHAYDCAAAGMTCGWQDDTLGYNCL